jgi:hypothetical protein
MTVLLVKSTAYARTEQETLAQCFMGHVAGRRRQWVIKLLSRTFLNPKTEQALKRQTLFVKARQAGHIGLVSEIRDRTFRMK